MDVIQQILLTLRELIIRIKEIFSFVNTQFLPMTEEEEKEYVKHDYDYIY